MKTKRGSNRTKGAPALPGAGRPPKSATIVNGAPLMLSQVWPGEDGGYADLGRGHAEIRRQGMSRIVVIPQPDGSEIRIIIV